MLIELETYEGMTREACLKQFTLIDHDQIIRIVPVTSDQLEVMDIPSLIQNPPSSAFVTRDGDKVFTTASPHQIAALIASARALTTRINHISPSTKAVCAAYSHVRLNGEGEAEWVYA